MKTDKIMLCVDGQDSFDAVKARTAALVKKLGKELLLLRVVRPVESELDRAVGTVRPESAEVEAMAKDPALHGLAVTPYHPATDRLLPEAIVDAAKKHDVDLTLVPTHGREGFDRLIHGSVAEALIRRCEIPVLTLPLDRDGTPVDHVVVLTDFSEMSKRALSPALRLAERFGCAATLCHVFDDEFIGMYTMGGVIDVVQLQENMAQSAKAQLEEMAMQVAKPAGVTLGTALERGNLSRCVEAFVGKFKNPVVVLASAGRDSFGDHLLGSSAERLVRAAHASTLVLPVTQAG